MRVPGGRRAAWFVAVAVVASVAGGAVLFSSAGDDGPRFRSGGSLPGEIAGSKAPRIRLIDARGGVTDTDGLRGRPYLVTFLFTSCRDVCPLIAQEIRQALRLLGRQGRELTALAVTVDPEGDTPAAVRAWLEERRLPANFRYLIGTRAKLRPVWNSYFVGPQPEGETESRHTANVWLVDRAGRRRTKFSGGTSIDPADLAHDLRVLLAEE